MCFQPSNGGIDQSLRQTTRGTAGMQARPPWNSVSSITALSRRTRPSSAGVFSAATASGSISRSIERVMRIEASTAASELILRSRSSARWSRARVPGTLRVRDRTPTRGCGPIRSQHPTASVAQIHERKHWFSRHGQSLGRADRIQIAEDSVVARQQQMVAIVDTQSKLAVKIGSASSPSDRSCFDQRHGFAGLGQCNGGGQPRHTGTNDGDVRWHEDALGPRLQARP